MIIFQGNIYKNNNRVYVCLYIYYLKAKPKVSVFTDFSQTKK